MDTEKDYMKPLDPQELTRIEQENPNLIVNTMDQDQLNTSKEQILAMRKDEEELPILKQTEESLALFQHKMIMDYNNSDFVEKLANTKITAAIQHWLTQLNTGTRRNYAYYMTDMIRRDIIRERDEDGKELMIHHFRDAPHEVIIDHIKKVEGWSEGTRQVHAACYISFTAYLERISHGWVRKALPSTLASNPTFYQIRDKCATKALTLAEWHRFIKVLHGINQRDSLIARCMFQGAKRISEVLTLKFDQIDYEKCIIRFRQSKTGGTIKEIPITYPADFLVELKQYIEATRSKRINDYVFITRNGKAITRARLNYSFEKAGKDANIKKVTPHMLRATWVTFVKQQGVQDTEIMKVTGHTSSKMIYAYDKTSAEENCSKKFTLI